MRAVDTNLLVRLVARDDADQVQAAEEFVSPGAWVSHLVPAAMIWVLDSVCDLSRGQISTAVDMLLHRKQLTLQDADVVRLALDQY
jgi:predicted nucleic-acid-binding protein